MEKLDLLFILILILTLIITIMYGIYDEGKDIERVEYINNPAVTEMCIHQYNKTFENCTGDEKRKIIRKYKLKNYYNKSRHNWSEL